MMIEDKLLASRYHILKNIGSGAFGVTFLAEDRNIPTQPKCVVKQLKPLVNDPNHFEQAKKLFEKEAATLSKVGTHYQIPYLKDYFEEEGNFYLVQDFIDGKPLDQELIPNQQWSEPAVLALLKDCLPILDFIHSQKPPIIHRDIKPANLIRRHEDGKIVLVDFGAVKESFQTKLVQSTVAIGTRGYMPTEQIRGKPRPASDIFALGIVAIQALIGVNPIDLPEDENGELVWQYIEGEQGQLQTRVTVSTGLAEVLSKMIHHDFKDRYKTASEVIAALETLSTKSQPRATSVILPEELNGKIPPELNNQEIASPTQPEAETVQQDSAILEQETVQQQPVTQNQSSSTRFDDPSFVNDSSKASPDPAISSPKVKANNRIATWLQSPVVKNFGIASVILIIASVGMYGLERHRTIQEEQETQVRVETFKNEVASLFEQKEYQDCLSTVDSDSGNEIQEIKDIKTEFHGKCSLALAEFFARAENYPEALKLAEKIEPDSEVHEQVQTRIQDWSNQLVAQGVSEYKKNGNLENFNRVIGALSPSNPIREQAIEQKQQLKQLHEKNKKLLSSAQRALDNEQWQQAKQKAQTLQDAGNGYPYWEEQARLIVKDAEESLAAAQTPSQPAVPPKPSPAPSTTRAETPKPSPRPTQPSSVSPPPVTSQPSPAQVEPKPETTKTPTQWDPCAESSMFCSP